MECSCNTPSYSILSQFWWSGKILPFILLKLINNSSKNKGNHNYGGVWIPDLNWHGTALTWDMGRAGQDGLNLSDHRSSSSLFLSGSQSWYLFKLQKLQNVTIQFSMFLPWETQYLPSLLPPIINITPPLLLGFHPPVSLHHKFLEQ